MSAQIIQLFPTQTKTPKTPRPVDHGVCEPHYTGSRYNKDLSIVQIAKAVRRDIAAAKKSGSIPKTAKISVRTGHSTNHRSLTVEIKSFPSNVINTERVIVEREHPHDIYNAPNLPGRYSSSATDTLRALEEIVKEYSYDKSDSRNDYFNVGFYSHVDVAAELRISDRAIAEASI